MRGSYYSIRTRSTSHKRSWRGGAAWRARPRQHCCWSGMDRRVRSGMAHCFMSHDLPRTGLEGAQLSVRSPSWSVDVVTAPVLLMQAPAGHTTFHWTPNRTRPRVHGFSGYGASPCRLSQAAVDRTHWLGLTAGNSSMFMYYTHKQTRLGHGIALHRGRTGTCHGTS